MWENVFALYLTKKGPFTLKNYVVNCINPMFYVFAYSKEYSQNFTDRVFSSFRLLKSYLGKHLECKNYDFYL